LFYLRSRGLPLASARNLLIAGFCREAFGRVDNAELRTHLEAALLVRLPLLAEGTEAKPEELRDFLADKFAKWQLPERWTFIAEVPKTSVGKFDKKRCAMPWIFSRSLESRCSLFDD